MTSRDTKGRFLKGHKPVFTAARNKKLSERIKGHPVSLETREKLRLANLGKKNGPASEERKRKISEKLKGNKNWMNAKVSKTNTLPERIIEAELLRRSIKYEKQVYLCKTTFADFYIPEHRIVVYADGNYWHSLPKMKERDEKINRILAFNGFNVFRFWEKDIKRSVSDCLNQLPI